MKLYEYQWSRSFNDLHRRSLRFNSFKPFFAQKLLGRLKPNFIWSLHGMWGIKTCSNVQSHMTMPIYGEKLQKSSLEPSDRWPWNLVYSIGNSSTTNVFIWSPWDDLDHFMTGSNLFLNVLHGWKLIQHWVLMYFQVCSNSAFPQQSGERYRTSGPLVFVYPQACLQCWVSWVLSKTLKGVERGCHDDWVRKGITVFDDSLHWMH